MLNTPMPTELFGASSMHEVHNFTRAFFYLSKGPDHHLLTCLIVSVDEEIYHRNLSVNNCGRNLNMVVNIAEQRLGAVFLHASGLLFRANKSINLAVWR